MFCKHGQLNHPVENVAAKVMSNPDGSPHLIVFKLAGLLHRTDGGPAFWREDGHVTYAVRGERLPQPSL